MDWVWPLYEKHVMKGMKPFGGASVEAATEAEVSEEAVQNAFVEALGRSVVTILVQEPWRGSVRFKCLDKAAVRDRFDLLNAPNEFLVSRYGGGKFKLNFHDGFNFVATRNFKPDGDPLWVDLPEFEEESVL